MKVNVCAWSAAEKIYIKEMSTLQIQSTAHERKQKQTTQTFFSVT